MLIKILLAWFALSLLFVCGWSRWQGHLEKYDGKK